MKDSLGRLAMYVQPFFPILLLATIIACRKRRLALCFSIVLLLFAFPPAAWLASFMLEVPYSRQAPQSAGEAIVVLSSSVLPPNGPREDYILAEDTYAR